MTYAIDPIFGCHLWTGRKDRDGYGLTTHGRRAHIVAWEARVAPVPKEMELDHICRRRACCNVEHLEPVSRSENERRKALSFRLRRPACRRGHPFHVHGAITPEGGRVCRECTRLTRGAT